MLSRYSLRLRHTKKMGMFFLISLTSMLVTVLIYQVIFLDESEFLTDFEDEDRKWNSIKSWPKILRNKLIQTVRNTTTSSCPNLSIRGKSVSTSPAICRLPRVREDACSFAKSLFTAGSLNVACNNSLVNLCKVDKGVHSAHTKVQCHTTSCGSSDIISVGFIDPDNGSLRWQHYAFLQDVERELNNYIQHTTSQQYFPFAFLRCDEFWNPTAKTQLLILPPKGVTGEKSSRKHKTRPININIILIDSVSRPHFYRSLPQTVKTFRNINAKSSTMVLDFELFHSIKPRTFETVHALFSGELLDVEQFVNPMPVKAAVMFNKFKSLGYQTMWQEDMCWTYEWGLVRDFTVMNKSRPLMEIWHKLKTALKNNSIDFTGITHSSCEVLKSFGVPEPFHGPPKLCYGGKHYHSHFLHFLGNFIDEVNSDSDRMPLFSFTLLDVGHEDSGKRIQTLDASLSDFVSNVASDPNTLSIILSDHGNTYGSFPLTIDGRFEACQPHLFMIVSEKIQTLLGKDKMQGLIHNQKRLVSVVDLHHAVMSVAAVIGGETLGRKDQGLLQPVSRNRSCEDIGLMTSSLCICQGWETRVHTKSFHFIVAEFVLGAINEKIQSQFLGNSKNKWPVAGFGSCQRLRGQRIVNVRERRDGKVLTVSLDIVVQFEEVFSTEVKVITGDVLLDMKLIHFSRISEYGNYQTCADEGVDVRLCICKEMSESKDDLGMVQILPKLEWQHYGESFHSATKADNLHNNCLFILLREFKSGVVFEAANSCSFVVYNVELHLSLSNMQVSEQTPIRKDIQPGTIHFLIAVVQLNPTVNWAWKYTVNFTWTLLS